MRSSMKKIRYNKKISDSFYDDSFSYLAFEAEDEELSFEGEIEMNNLLEDHNIEDLDVSVLNDNIIEDISLI
jgi:hypothetical protein